MRLAPTRIAIAAALAFACALHGTQARAQTSGRDARPSGETSGRDARPSGETSGRDARPSGETSDADKREAARLFALGRSQLDAKAYDAACANLATSDAMDPSVGTLGLLAACHELEGMLATAYREYVETAKRAHIASDAREKYALEHAESLRGLVPILVVRSAGSEAGLEILEGTRKLELNQEVMLDPGAHTISARATGKKPWQTEVSLAPKERRDVAVPRLEDDATIAPAAAPAPPRVAERAPPPPHRDSASGGRVAGFALLGLGAAGFTAAGVTGAMVLDRASTVDRECPTGRCRTAEGYDAAKSGRTLVVVNAIAWAVALAGAGAGLILVLTAPSARRSGASAASATGAEVGWRGQF